MSKTRPLDPDRLRARLVELCPRYQPPPPEEHDDELGMHSVMADFLVWFGRYGRELDARALQRIASFLDEAVVLNDNLENAVSTCFLEHLRQVQGHQALAPYLSRSVKSKLRAL